MVGIARPMKVETMNRRIEFLWCVASVGALLSLGCAASHNASGPARLVCPEGITTAAAMDAAHKVLAEMHFPIEKLDAEHGVIRTRPLRAGQFFELWQCDNVGGYNEAEANVQSIRRTVELRVIPEAEGPRIECDVLVQRLALPGNEVAGVSQAYLMHTRSQSTLLAFEVTPQQRQGMAWVDLGADPDLAAEILKRVERRLFH
jgi:hypothetical protein